MYTFAEKYNKVWSFVSVFSSGLKHIADIFSLLLNLLQYNIDILIMNYDRPGVDFIKLFCPNWNETYPKNHGIFNVQFHKNNSALKIMSIWATQITS